jgi:hypothetical protein
MMLNRAGERVQRQRRRSMGVRDTSKDEIGKVQDMVISFCEWVAARKVEYGEENERRRRLYGSLTGGSRVWHMDHMVNGKETQSILFVSRIPNQTKIVDGIIPSYLAPKPNTLVIFISITTYQPKVDTLDIQLNKVIHMYLRNLLPPTLYKSLCNATNNLVQHILHLFEILYHFDFSGPYILYLNIHYIQMHNCILLGK